MGLLVLDNDVQFISSNLELLQIGFSRTFQYTTVKIKFRTMATTYQFAL